jgi:predicted lipoprotein with Yx(FWY)xxD motif
MTVNSRSWRQLAAISGIALLAACSSSGRMQTYEPTQTSSINYNNSFKMTATDSGNVLSTERGMTLYTFDDDMRNQSTCYGDCAQKWPPYLANSAAKPSGDLTLITRSDGTRQWAESGRPLYTYVRDTSPGEYRGDDLNNAWHVVRDDGRSATQASSSTTNQPGTLPYNTSFRMVRTSSGDVLSTSRGMTLYTYESDARNQSNCYGECTNTWQPYLADVNARPNGQLALITRTDGTKQWASNGMPLYTYVRDMGPGEYRGDDFDNVWHVVRHDGQSALQASDQAPYLATYEPTTQPTYQLGALPNNASFRTIRVGSDDVLSTSRGMTLYTYEGDARNRSNCYDDCARYWRPYLGTATATTGGDLTLIARADGTNQWADNGQPLYTYFDDSYPGDTKGLTHTEWQLVR